MARTALSVQEIDLTGLSPTYSDANADGHSITNTGDVFLHVKNASASDITVTCQTPAKIEGIDIAEITVTVAASGEKMIGPFNPTIFNQSDGSVYVDYSATASVTVAAVRLKR